MELLEPIVPNQNSTHLGSNPLTSKFSVGRTSRARLTKLGTRGISMPRNPKMSSISVYLCRLRRYIAPKNHSSENAETHKNQFWEISLHQFIEHLKLCFLSNFQLPSSSFATAMVQNVEILTFFEDLPFHGEWSKSLIQKRVLFLKFCSFLWAVFRIRSLWS